MADLKGGGGGGEILSGAQGWECVHCGGFYGVELIFMQLKEAARALGGRTLSVLIVLASLAPVCTWYYQAAALPFGD